MFCQKCGYQLPDGVTNRSKCGTKIIDDLKSSNQAEEGSSIISK